MAAQGFFLFMTQVGETQSNECKHKKRASRLGGVWRMPDPSAWTRQPFTRKPNHLVPIRLLPATRNSSKLPVHQQSNILTTQKHHNNILKRRPREGEDTNVATASRNEQEGGGYTKSANR